MYRFTLTCAPDILGRSMHKPVLAGLHVQASSDHEVACRPILFLLILSTGYHWLLVALQTNAGLRVSVGSVALLEFLVYFCVTFVVLFRRLPMKVFAAFFLGFGLFFVYAVARDGFVDVKGIRDLLIPSLFYVLAAQSGFSDVQERKVVVSVSGMVMLGLIVELLLADHYGRFFNTFRYHSSIGTIASNAAHFKGMDVTLNALRPEGVGKTALSFLVGQRRLSSVFAEPVSLGNFSVVLSAWLLSQSKSSWRLNLWLWGSALSMSLLSDSRFAMMSIVVLFVLRIFFDVRILRFVSLVAPILGVLLVIFVSVYFPSHQDNLQGRLTAAGLALQNLPVEGFWGLKGFHLPLGDMGYAYLIVHFGVPVAIALWVWVALRIDGDEQHQLFRALALIYMAMILAVSGSSVFSLKTAGFLWFLIGIGEVRAWSVSARGQRPSSGVRTVHA